MNKLKYGELSAVLNVAYYDRAATTPISSQVTWRKYGSLIGCFFFDTRLLWSRQPCQLYMDINNLLTRRMPISEAWTTRKISKLVQSRFLMEGRWCPSYLPKLRVEKTWLSPVLDPVFQLIGPAFQKTVFLRCFIIHVTGKIATVG